MSTLLEREIVGRIDNALARIGLLYRHFSRVKDLSSIHEKIIRKGYAEDRKLQDAFGIRLAFYFVEDIQVCSDVVAEQFVLVSETVDTPDNLTFGPARNNKVFRLPTHCRGPLRSVTGNIATVDDTFELQLRTMLSEGWHEVEHDLRYRHPDHWHGHADLDRAYNGVAATLETCDWTTQQLFEELAWRHYKSAMWDAMLRCKFRVRFLRAPLLPAVEQYLSKQRESAKQVLRTSRRKLLHAMHRAPVQLPITVSNWLFAANRLEIRDGELRALEPQSVRDLLNEAEGYWQQRRSITPQ